MTEAVPHLKFVIILPQPCCENRIKHEDPSHTVAGMNSCLFMPLFETHLPLHQAMLRMTSAAQISVPLIIFASNRFGPP
jgi:hypothetical protein